MQEQDQTPEDRLFAIVDNKLPAEGPAPARARRRGVAAWAGKFFPAPGASWGLKAVSRILMAVCAVLTGIFAGYYMHVNAQAVRHFRLVASSPAQGAVAADTDIQGADFTRVAFLLKKRNIFSLVPSATDDGGSVIGDREEVAEFKLVGILWSDRPQAMIENVQEQKTYLLNQGDMLGNFKVKDVLKEKVVLEKNGRVWELM